MIYLFVSGVPDMRFIKLPPVIINFFYLLVRTFKKGNIVDIPLIVFAIILLRKSILIKTGKTIFFRTLIK